MLRRCVLFFFSTLLSARADFPFRSVAFIIDVQGCVTSSRTPTPDQIRNFETYYTTDIEGGMPWFWKSCSHGKWSWDPSDQVFVRTPVPVPCTGMFVSSPAAPAQPYNLAQSDNLGVYIARQAAVDAFRAQTGRDLMSEPGTRVIVLNALIANAYGDAQQMCGSQPGCLVNTGSDRNFPTDGSAPRLNTIIHELGHTLGLVHSEGAVAPGTTMNWEYGDQTCIMGSADDQFTCFGPVSARFLGWSSPTADVDDANLPLNMWVPFWVPIMSVSPINHVRVRTLASNQALLFVARSKTASQTHADKNIKFGFQDLLEGTSRLTVVASSRQAPSMMLNSIFMGAISAAGGTLDLGTVSVPSNNGAKMANVNLIIRLAGMSDASGAVFSLCRYASSPSACTFENTTMEASMNGLSASAIGSLSFLKLSAS